MESATASGEPTFETPNGRVETPPTLRVIDGENKTRLTPLQETRRVIGLKEFESLGDYTNAGTLQVGPTIGGNASLSGASLSGGLIRGEATASLGGQARYARPALGECERTGCDEQATKLKTLYCGHRAEYCDEHARTEW